MQEGLGKYIQFSVILRTQQFSFAHLTFCSFKITMEFPQVQIPYYDTRQKSWDGGRNILILDRVHRFYVLIFCRSSDREVNKATNFNVNNIGMK